MEEGDCWGGRFGGGVVDRGCVCWEGWGGADGVLSLGVGFGEQGGNGCLCVWVRGFAVEAASGGLAGAAGRWPEGEGRGAD